MNLATLILHIYPDIDLLDKVRIINIDGAESLEYWGDSRPQPTEQELEAIRLPVTRQNKIASLKASCKSAIESGFSSSALGTPHTYDSELPTDQTNIIGAMVASLSGASIPFTCTDSNGYKEQRLHTSAQLQQVFQAGMQHIVVNKSKYDALKKQVEQAEDGEAVNGINW